MNNYQEVKLANGVTAILVPLKGLHSVTVEVFIKIGSRYEKRNEFGISHFLEHMAFKGTEKRPSATVINKELDAKGVVHNAATGHEWTSYFIKTIRENIDWSAELLADIILNSTLPEEEINKEKGVIAEEIKMYEDNPTMGMSFDFINFLFKTKKIGCWNITGAVEEVMAVNRGKLVDYRRRSLEPERMVVAVAGDLGNQNQKLKIKDQMEKYFGKFKGSGEDLPEAIIEFGEEKVLRKIKQLDQAHYCLGWPTIGWTDGRRYVGKLIDIMLLGNTSSRLWNKIREEKGMAYYIFSVSESFKEAGFMGVQVGVNKNRMAEAIEATKSELLDFGKSLTEEELVRAKDYIFGKIKLNLDETDFWTDFVGQKRLLEGKMIEMSQLIKEYQAVTLKDIKQFCENFLLKDHLRLMTLANI